MYVIRRVTMYNGFGAVVQSARSLHVTPFDNVATRYGRYCRYVAVKITYLVSGEQKISQIFPCGLTFQ